MSLQFGRYLSLLLAIFFVATSAQHSHAANNLGEVDSSWNTNNNKPGTPCFKQMAKVRKLEFDPRFETTKAIRVEWSREMDVARRMGCEL